jgi:benzil reductase ((S)-benzoin forming)
VAKVERSRPFACAVEGATCVVTGASRGLGAGMAARFADTGLKLGLCARTMPPIPESALVGRVLSRVLDVADREAVESFAEEVEDRLGPILLWVNNAGLLGPVGSLARAAPELIEATVATNLLGAMHASAVFARLVRSRRAGGVLVNISSGAAEHPYEGWAAYCATKAGLEAMTRVVAREEAPFGLRAYALRPGVVDTPMQEAVRSSRPEDFPEVGRFLALHERGEFNSPSWVADFILDLAFGRTARGGGTGLLAAASSSGVTVPPGILRGDFPDVVLTVPPERHPV